MYEVTAFHDADSILVAENNLKDAQREIDRLRGRQLSWLKMVVRHRGIVRDGYRSLVDWTASRLDIPHTVARDLAYLARRLDDDTYRFDSSEDISRSTARYPNNASSKPEQPPPTSPRQRTWTWQG